MADQNLFLMISGLAGKSRLLDFLGIFSAEYLGYVLIAGFLIFVFSLTNFKERFRLLSFVLLSLIVSRGILTELIRFFYHRPRPFMVLEITPLITEADKGAFPSGHAAFYFALALSLLFFNRKLGWYFIGASILMGISRVFVGVHWPLDIVGGIVVALISVYSVNLLLSKIK